MPITNRSFIRFFFQAEDGIRDRTVTGVQTCALPISYRPVARASSWFKLTASLCSVFSCPGRGWLIQVTVAPAGTAMVCGEQLTLSIKTSVLAARGADNFPGPESLPCVLLRSARATNMAKAREPIFNCLRNRDVNRLPLVLGP